MTMKEVAFKIEDLQVRAEKVNSLQNALWQAIYRGDIAAESFEWAFVALGDLTFDLKNDLKRLTDAAFDSFRKEDGNYV